MDNQKNTSRRRFRNDILFIAVLLLLVAVGVIYLFLFRGRGNTVRVMVDGEVYGVYSLSENRVVEIRTGDDGERLNCLVIKDGEAFVETASCPDKICSNHRAVFRDGESIICLPNKVVITIVADKTDDAPDAVT
jgi:hypothetical protein